MPVAEHLAVAQVASVFSVLAQEFSTAARNVSHYRTNVCLRFQKFLNTPHLVKFILEQLDSIFIYTELKVKLSM